MFSVLATFFSFIAFLTIDRSISEGEYYFLTICLIAWLPAILWAVYVIGKHHLGKGPKAVLIQK